MTSAYDPIRRFQRFKTDFRVKIFYQAEGKQRSEVVRSYECSRGGVSVYAPMELPTDCAMEVEFILPGQPDGLKLKANIRNRRGFRYGMEFTGVTKEQAKVLAAFVAHLEETAKR